MAYTTGNATDYLDLLGKVKAAAVTEGWTVERETYNAGTDTDGELILNGPGLDDAQNIIVGIQTFRDEVSDYFNWELKGAQDFNGEAWADLPQQSVSTYLALWDDTITYWLMVNKQRILLVTKVSTVYMHMYLGYIDTYATDEEYEYPLLIAGSSTNLSNRWSSTSLAAWWSGLLSSLPAQMCMPDRSWKTLGNNDPRVWPWVVGGTELSKLRDSFGQWPLMPAILYSGLSTGAPDGVLGEVDGLYYVTGFSLGVEDIVQVGAQNYLVAQDTYRNTISNFCAVELL